MVKIHTLTHDPQSSVVRTPLTEHAFSRAREYQRAFNAVKLNKLFSKPLLGTLQGHSDGISVLQKCTLSLNKMISGAHDGEIKIWDLSERKSLISIYDHTMSVKGVCFNKDGTKFISSSADKTINLYSFKAILQSQEEDLHKSYSLYEKKLTKKVQPLTKYMSKYVTNNVDHSPTEMEFVTSGDIVQVWSYERSKPIYEFQWNVDSILKVKYNPSEHNIVLGSCSDRSLILYDLRAESPVQKVTLPNKSMCMAFNPLQPINFTVGNDDSNCYSFDLRRMDKAKIIHKDHIGAVTDLDFSPTGRQFVTGSFDRTVRIFNYDQGRSRQVYHTKRMQIVSSVSYTMDGNYVLSGSEDMNIRLWKNVAYKPTGVVNQRQSRAIEYREKLVEKYVHTNKIRRIHNHRHLPKYILNAKKRRQDQAQSKFNKRVNKEANTGIKQDPINLKQKVIENIQFPEEKIQRRKKNKGNKNGRPQTFQEEQQYQEQMDRQQE